MDEDKKLTKRSIFRGQFTRRDLVTGLLFYSPIIIGVGLVIFAKQSFNNSSIGILRWLYKGGSFIGLLFLWGISGIVLIVKKKDMPLGLFPVSKHRQKINVITGLLMVVMLWGCLIVAVLDKIMIGTFFIK